MTRQGTGHTARAKAAQMGRAPRPRARVLAPLPFRWEGPTPQAIIGLDPGVSTGLALLGPAGFRNIESAGIHEAMDVARMVANDDDADRVLFVFEDARLRQWYGKSGPEVLQGAGSIKRDCGIWADYLTSLGVRYHGISPEAKGPKLNAAQFARRFGWTERTNEHCRDAGLVAAYGAALVGMRVDYLPGSQP